MPSGHLEHLGGIMPGPCSTTCCSSSALVRAAVRSRAELVAENLLLRQQLAVLTRPTRRASAAPPRDRLFWALARRLRRDWRRHLVLVRPETVIRWHRRGWRLFWRWRSRTRAGPAAAEPARSGS